MKTCKLLFALSLSALLISCGSTSDESRGIKPEITVIDPVDSLDLNQPIPVKILYSDNLGLTYTEISLGSQTAGNVAYHYSQRGLNGTSDEIEFSVEVPLGVDASGENYILIKCRDEDDNEAVLEEPFYLVDLDGEAPQITNLSANGALTTDPNTAFEVSYTLSDNKALAQLDLSLRAWDGSNLGASIISTSIDLQGQSSAASFWTVPGSSNYNSGQEFKIEAYLSDAAGNSSSLVSTAVYTIL